MTAAWRAMSSSAALVTFARIAASDSPLAVFHLFLRSLIPTSVATALSDATSFRIMISSLPHRQPSAMFRRRFRSHVNLKDEAER